MDLCDRNDIQALLARHGFHFAKALGQNFLIRGDVAEDIAAAGCVPGCGRCWRRLWRTMTTSP